MGYPLFVIRLNKKSYYKSTFLHKNAKYTAFTDFLYTFTKKHSYIHYESTIQKDVTVVNDVPDIRTYIMR